MRRLRGLVDPDEPQRAGREEDVLPLLDELEAGRVQVRQRHVGSNGLLDSAILHAVRDVLDERVLARAIDKALAKLRAGARSDDDRGARI